MFGPIGGPEFLLLLALALLLFGPRRLPAIGRSLGKALAEFRGATRDFKATLEREVEVEELRDVRRDIGSAAQDLTGAARDLRNPLSGGAEPRRPGGDPPEKNGRGPADS